MLPLSSLNLTNPCSDQSIGTALEKLILSTTFYRCLHLKAKCYNYIMNNLPIILASGSPRRQELLKQIGIDFVGLSSNVSEEIEDGILPSDAVNILAERKAQAITLANPDSLVIGADTVIALGNEILGKPHTVAKAREMLKKMSGRTHQVITGVCLKCLNKNVNEVFNVVTDVTFNQLSEDLIDRYIKTGEPLDKSGSYAI